MRRFTLKDKKVYYALLILLLFSLIHIFCPNEILESYKKNRKSLEKLSPNQNKLIIILIRAVGFLFLLICIILFIQFGL